MTPQEFLASVETILLIDWPDRRVPEAFLRAGFRVFVRGGPGPQDFSAYELRDGEVATRRIGAPPDRADLVYAYRPLNELPGIVALAQTLAAKAIWTQSNLDDAETQQARYLIESANLLHLTGPVR